MPSRAHVAPVGVVGVEGWTIVGVVGLCASAVEEAEGSLVRSLFRSRPLRARRAWLLEDEDEASALPPRAAVTVETRSCMKSSVCMVTVLAWLGFSLVLCVGAGEVCPVAVAGG